jgi:peptide/nickel transport system substrate-binding protein
VYFHKEALATNIWNVNFSILPKHVYQPLFDRLKTKEWVDLQDDPDYVALESKPVVGGAYEIASRRRNQEIVCNRRESYYMHKGKQVRDKPYFRQIRFKVVTEPTVALIALKSCEIDEMELRPDQWVSQTIDNDFYQRNTKGYGVEHTSFHFAWNTKTPFFSDRRVREAMSYAFDHDEMLSKLCYGLYQPAAGIFHPESWAASKNPAKPYKQDLDKAEALLDEAGWVDSDNDGIRDKEIRGKVVPFEFNILVRQDPERIRICELLKFNLEQIGVICNISPLEATVLFERTQNKKFVAYMGGWGAGADPDTSINIWGTGEDRNYGSYSNPEVDKLFAQGRREFDRKKRAAIYGRIQDLIYADQPYTWLYYRNSFYGFNKGLRGWNFSQRGPYHYGPGFSSIWRAAAN